MKGWRIATMALALTLVVAVLPVLAIGATPTVEKHSFWLTGRLVSVKGTTLVIKVSRAPQAIVRYEQKGELTVLLAPKAAMKMGQRSIAPAALKPGELVSVSGWYTLAGTPTFEATSIIVTVSK
ncbi:MAG TPA: hypothetical protein VGR25_03490 [bacterium]|jgi:hypothetical protein|nr:hypothetical protein [bacterium]